MDAAYFDGIRRRAIVVVATLATRFPAAEQGANDGSSSACLTG